MMLAMPTAVISGAIATAIVQAVGMSERRAAPIRPLLLKATIALTVLGALPFGVVAFVGPKLFTVALGAEWLVAGEYARWLSLWLFANFVAGPCSQAAALLNLQGPMLRLQVVTETLRTSFFFLGAAYYGSDIVAVVLFSLVGAAANIWIIVWILKASGARECRT
jgi:O-antigen/teichoic acid export membrane protein